MTGLKNAELEFFETPLPGALMGTGNGILDRKSVQAMGGDNISRATGAAAVSGVWTQYAVSI